jgi:hypothetical protein
MISIAGIVNSQREYSFEQVNRYSQKKKRPMVYPKSIYFCRKVIAMKVLSLKLDDDVFEETERIISKLELARNRYINEALALYNKYNRRKMLKSQLAKEAVLANATSMDVLREFEALDYDQAI